MASFTDWLGGVNLGSLGQGLLGGIGYTNLMSDLQQTGRDAQAGAQAIGEQAVTSTAFKPYTVTTASGGRAGYDEAGNVFQQLGGQEAAIQNQLLGQAGNMYSQAMQTNPYLQQQASMFGGMSQNYTPTQFSAYNLGTYDPQTMAGLGQSQAAQITDTVSPYGFGNAQLGQLSGQALNMGMGQLGAVQGAGAQAQGLANQYAGLASQAGQGLLTDTTQREQDIYNRIRAAQSPEEQRQALALEERLAAQGRLGVQTNQYGGTPEQLAMAKAQEEAKNAAMLSAMQQAGTEQQQALAAAQGIGSMAQGFMGQASDLQSAAQARAQQLSNMGMSAAQINSQLQSEGLGRSLQAGEYNRQGTMLSDALTQSDFQRRLAAGEFGLQGQQVASALATQALGRDVTQGQFGLQQQQQQQQMRTQDIQNMLALAGGSQQALAQQLGLQTGYGQLGQGMLSGAYVPQSALLNAMQQGTAVQELADLARRQGGQLQAEAGMAGLDALLQSQLGAANLGGQGLAALAALMGGSSVTKDGTTVAGGLTLGDVGGMLSGGWDWLNQNVFNPTQPLDNQSITNPNDFSGVA